MPDKNITTTRFGPLLTERGVSFRLWAPAAREVNLVLEPVPGSSRRLARAQAPAGIQGDRKLTMEKHGDWFLLEVTGAKAGTRYKFAIDGEIEIPDPASHFQPDDVHGPSEVIDHAFDWQCTAWRGRLWHEAVLLEAHVGTFSPEGTFRGAERKLDHLADTGFTALELMPVADFAGRWNWGYDGVLPFAPDSRYGRPEELKALIDAAHARGLMMFLDVVYNHLGPEGNYLPRIAPRFFSEAHTPWGGAIDYRVPEVRAFAIENVLHWLRHYRFDGLRLDAVNTIVTPGEPHILRDLSLAAGALARQNGRHIHLVLENGDNRASLLAPDEDPPAGRYRAQWNDDYHHAWHVLLTGEDQGYYEDYSGIVAAEDARLSEHDGEPARHIVRAMAEGFVYQGEVSAFRNGRPRGEPSGHLSPCAFVNFLQNHDQVGNRPLGERLSVLAKPEAVAAALSVLLLSPSPPLLFMGEEWGATEPFAFFCDFTGVLAAAVRNGRRREFAEAYARYGNEIPDPLAARTRSGAMLDWNFSATPVHAQRLALTRALLEVRRRAIAPLLPAIKSGGEASFQDGVLTARWQAGAKTLLLLANLSAAVAARPATLNWGEPIWGGAPSARLSPRTVFAAIGGA
jgi:maltooligosyltrehalose trehalohydrolase